MRQMPNEVHDTLVDMVAELSGTPVSDVPSSQEQRQEWRRPIDAECRVYCFRGSKQAPCAFEGRTKDLAFSGVALFADLDGSLRRHSPVEVVVKMVDGTSRHLAGVVAYCRESEGKQFELGVSVCAAGQNPILIRDVEGAVDLYDWFRDALESLD